MDKKFLVFLIPLISVITIFGIFAMFSQPVAVQPIVVQPVAVQPIVVSQGFDSEYSACARIIRENGDIEDLGCNHNVYTNRGKNVTSDMMFRQIYYGNFTYIGLCNVTAGCTADATDITLDNEYTTCGLSRAAGEYTIVTASPGNGTLYKRFTSTCNGVSTNMTGIFNQSSGGTLLAVIQFTDGTLQNNDQLDINATLTQT